MSENFDKSLGFIKAIMIESYVTDCIVILGAAFLILKSRKIQMDLVPILCWVLILEQTCFCIFRNILYITVRCHIECPPKTEC